MTGETRINNGECHPKLLVPPASMAQGDSGKAFLFD